MPLFSNCRSGRLARLVFTLGLSLATGLAASAGAQANQAPLVEIASGFQSAGYSDLAIGSDGLIHAVWQDKQPGQTFEGVFHSISRDGVQWSPPVELSGGEGRVSFVRTAVDGAGRVYAMWKATTSLAADINDASTLNSENGSLRYRVFENGRWSGIVPVGRENNVFGWFPAVDGQKRLNLVWSENSDPENISAMVWNNSATTVWRARVDGGAFDREVVVSDPAVGFYALDGYVDGHDRVRFAALAQRGLLHWSGAQLSILKEVIEANDAKEAPRLLTNARGEERLIGWHGPSNAIVDWPTATDGSPAVMAFQAPEGSVVEGFQVWSLAGGEIAVTAEVESANGLVTDLNLVRTQGGMWQGPVSVTGNAELGAGAGYISPGGHMLTSGSAWIAAYASAAAGPNGEVNLLLTNQRTEAQTIDWMAGRSGGGWSYPQIYFTRIGGVIEQQGTQLPAPVVTDERAPGPGNDPTPGPNPGPRVEPLAGLPLGIYACTRVAQYIGEIRSGTSVTVLPGNRYQVSDGSSGDFAVEAAGAVRWLSGPFADGAIAAEAFRREDGIQVISLMGESGPETCFIH